MRALGPGSVSSFLTVILNVVYVVLWIGAGVSLLGAIAAPLVPGDAKAFSYFHFSLDATPGTLSLTPPIAAAACAAIGLYAAGLLVIVGRLRSIFKALTAGDPFHPDNVRRLQIIGLALAALEVGRYLSDRLFHMLFGANDAQWFSLNLTAWFSVLVVFVLAEVFREGARLRREAELTI
ncbi:MAG: hypothetical protein JWP35_480 [Caulobacter sp.]|nr:hypothetical protein [Caulobacter sp.]